MSRRLSICVFYDKESKIDRYVSTLLKTLHNHCDKVVAICNMTDILKGKEYLSYADDILLRENMGFDVGGWKDAIDSYSRNGKLYDYDELIMVNDSFYGPFADFDDLFSLMEQKDFDFWGITESSGGENWFGLKNQISPHLQSYFVTVKKKMFASRVFIEYWHNMEYPKSFAEAVLNHEGVFTDYFSGLGFKYGSYISVKRKDLLCGKNLHPFLANAVELLKDKEISIIKRKALNITRCDFVDIVRILDRLDVEEGYDTSAIWDNLFRVGKNFKNELGIDYTKLKVFYNTHSRVFVYGSGVVGKNVMALFDILGWRRHGILVSEIDQGGFSMKFDDVNFQENDGVIVAISAPKRQGVYNHIRTKLDKSQIFMLSDG